MKKVSSAVTLEDISSLMDAKLDGLKGELKQEIKKSKVETLTEIGSLRQEMNQRFGLVDKRFEQVDQRFNAVLDTIQQAMEDVRVLLAPRIERFERKIFGTQIWLALE